MIPALARWNGDHAMTKDTTKEAAVAAEGLSQPAPIAKADRRAGVRADQAGTRISTIPAAWP